MNYIDKNIKTINQDKTIGIIICKKDNVFLMEYCSDPRILSRAYILNSKYQIPQYMADDNPQPIDILVQTYHSKYLLLEANDIDYIYFHHMPISVYIEFLRFLRVHPKYFLMRF